MSSPEIRIGDRRIGPVHAAYVIAEIGVNHDGDPQRAVMLTEAAARAGADAVKFQLFETDRLMSKAAKLAAYQKDAGEADPFRMLRRLELSIDELAPSVERAHALGIHAIVSVFSVELVEVAERLPWDAYKSASPDVINRPLLEAMGATGKPLVVSTGASTLDEVARAAEWLEHARGRLAMLQCVSSYPAPEDAFGGIGAIADATGLVVGYSDHTPRAEAGAEAVAAGACLLEKHMTHDVAAVGPDHAASLEPGAFARYTELAKRTLAGKSSGGGEKRLLDCEHDVREVSRQSLVAVRDLRVDQTVGRRDLTIKRPGMGIEPWRMDEIVGRTVVRDIAADMPLTEADLSRLSGAA
ncbi:MAG: N-acetylneuraminate synthase family protein [Planctomycetota bacterium]